MVSDDVEPSFEEALPSPNHSNPDLPPDRHEMDPVPCETTEAEQAPGRQRSVAQERPIALLVAVQAIARSDPKHAGGLKDFDRVYMPGLEGFVDSI